MLGMGFPPVTLNDLEFDEHLVEARAANPWLDEVNLLRSMQPKVIQKFEDFFWLRREEWDKVLSDRVYRQIEKGKGIDHEKKWGAVAERAFVAILKAAAAKPELANRVSELNFYDLMYRLFFLRDGINRFNQQDIAGALDTVLQSWPHYTETICAVAAAYGHMLVLKRENIRKKIVRNLHDLPKPQCRDFDRVVALLFPQASSWLHSPYGTWILRYLL